MSAAIRAGEARLTDSLAAILRSVAECPRLGYPVRRSEYRQIEVLINMGMLERRVDSHGRVRMTELGEKALQGRDSGEADD